MIDTGVARLLVDATIAIDCGLLAVLFAPLLACLGAFLDTLDGNAGRRFPAADRGWLKSCRLGTGGVMGGEATPSFGGALGRASVDAWRGHENALPCVWLLVVPASVPLGSRKNSSVHWARHSSASTCTVQVIRSPDGPSYRSETWEK
jgi:hypothetical protein